MISPLSPALLIVSLTIISVSLADIATPPSALLPIPAAVFDPSEKDRDDLCRLLLRHPSVHVQSSMGRFSPDTAARLLFIDPTGIDAKGFAWMQTRPSDVEIVFTSRSSQWSMQGHELGVLDYLIKPLAAERLGQTIRRLLRLDWQSRSESTAQKLYVAFERGRRLVTVEEICAVRAFGNYTQVFLAAGATEIVLRSLSRWTETLPPDAFVRVHRNLIVNRTRIRSLARSEGDGRLLHVDGVPEPLPVSRRLSRDLQKLLPLAS